MSMVLFRTLKSCVEHNHRLSSSYTDDEIEKLGLIFLAKLPEGADETVLRSTETYFAFLPVISSIRKSVKMAH